MSIMFADDFMGYGYNSALLLNGLWADITVSAIDNDPDPSVVGGRVLRVWRNLGEGAFARRVFPDGDHAIVGVGFRLWLNALPGLNGNNILCAMKDGGNNYRLMICVDTTGKIVVRNYRPANGTAPIIAATAVPVLVANAWNHIETRFTMGTPIGGIEVRVNGVTVLDAVVDAGANFSAQVSLECGEGAFSPAYYKDFVVWNDDGAHNNDFLGTVSVVGLTPNADVSLGGWTPSTGTTGYNLLDNSPPDDGTQYLTAAFPPPAPMQFGLTNLPVNVSSVRALITQVRARKADGGDGNIQATLISSGDAATGADRPITTAFTYYEDVFEVDPHTAAPWTPGAADLATLQIDRSL